MAGAACWDGGGKRQELITGGAKGRAAGVLGRWSVDRESRIFLNANERDLGKMRLEMWERDGVPYGRGPWGTQGPGERLACSVCVGGALSPLQEGLEQEKCPRPEEGWWRDAEFGSAASIPLA